ncbi:hypothetical protein LTR70_007320 [Exophiala xenobiotica]|uniref:Uncharacterized protein n=1 Tax=Lithohypha guttulata TaxID=1690604 RepID=A0ABR0K3Z5_9EURO|nr:hypothetical protein LTR24_007090 [Lithohypha guttulata]KAK5314109.1 hypothetical protein LTR70_007320 [Exophiala xenobiotica]
MKPPPFPTLSLFSLLTTTLNLTLTSATNLNVTALTYRGPISILQCWTVAPPFSTSTSGPIGASVASLGGVSGNASFIVQPPGSAGGYKNAPGPQWSWFISGLGHITLLNSTDKVWVVGGKYGLVYADDTDTYGHSTTFPSTDETVLLGLPTADGKQPEHEVLHEGACGWADLIGI